MKRRVGDREIAYDDVLGAGVALVLLHPFPFDRRYWTGTAAPFEAALRALLDKLARATPTTAAPGTA